MQPSHMIPWMTMPLYGGQVVQSVFYSTSTSEGWMRFYLNGERHGPGFTSDVKGPLVRALHLGGPIGDRVMAVPGAEPPAGCGGEEDVWVWPAEQPEEEDESESEAEA